ITLATGARQLVVQEALETTWCLPESYLSSLTPRTMVMSSFLAGAEMMTFFTGPRRCFLASVASVNLPVDSTTTCAPTDSHLMTAGSFSENTRSSFPSTLMHSPVARISCLRLPRMESYFSRCARVAGLVRSLTATNSMPESPRADRKGLRPIPPNPLIPTLIAIQIPPCREPGFDAEKETQEDHRTCSQGNNSG